jgi:Ni/Fe-hydrogenase subunit HybB-like protein
MYQAGHRVHPVWQTPMLPLLYLLMAWVIGLAFVVVVLQASCAIWKLPMDWKLLSGVARISGFLGIAWFVIRLGEVWYRGVLPKAFEGDLFTWVFLAEMLMVLIPSVLLASPGISETPRKAFNMLMTLCVGGMLYRYTPTTIAFMPGENYSYFPSVPEVLMSLGFIALAVVGYLYTVKRFPILPVPLQMYLRTAEAPAARVVKEQIA